MSEYELADILGTRAVGHTSKYDDDDEDLYDHLPENYFKVFLVRNNGYSLPQNTLSRFDVEQLDEADHPLTRNIPTHQTNNCK